MICRIDKSELAGEVPCPANKSYTHRAIFIGALSESSTIRNVLYSSDTRATIEACTELGAQIKRDGNTVTIISPITPGGNHHIDAANSGTTMRISAGIASLSSALTTISGDESLMGRPMQPILDVLESMGAKCTSSPGGRPPVSIRGRILGGEVSIRGDISSQFVSSLLICAPLTDRGMTVNIVGDLVSRPYLDATIATMERFGVSVDTIERYKKYRIEPQQYSETDFVVPPDYSSMALLLSAAVLVGGRDMVIMAPQDDCLPQGDTTFFGMLEELGVRVDRDGHSVRVRAPPALGGGTFDLSDSPDLLPPLSILSLRCGEPLEITRVRHARYKETDRISALCRGLGNLGVRVNEREDGMVLDSSGADLRGASLDSERDHRLFMAFSIAAMYVGNCSVSDPDCVEVSYPDFVQKMIGMGAKLGT